MCLKVVFRAWDLDTRRSTLLPDSVSQDGFATCMTEAEGIPEVLDKVVSVLRQDRYIFIEDMDVKNIPLEDDRGFHVRSGW